MGSTVRQIIVHLSAAGQKCSAQSPLRWPHFALLQISFRPAKRSRFPTYLLLYTRDGRHIGRNG